MEIICSNVGIKPSHNCEECCVMYKKCGAYKEWSGRDGRSAIEKMFDKLFSRGNEKWH